MTDKTRSHYILAGLVAAHLLLHGVALSLFITLTAPPEDAWPYVALVYALFMFGPTQGTLLAIWLALGGGRLLWRVVPTALGVVAYLWLFKDANSEWLYSIFWPLCIWGLLLLVARLTGLELVRNTELGNDSRRSQFYIRDMLGWMTTLAVIMSAMQCLPEQCHLSLSLLMDFAIFGVLGLVPGAAILSALGRRWLLARIMIIPLAVGVGAYVIRG